MIKWFSYMIQFLYDKAKKRDWTNFVARPGNVPDYEVVRIFKARKIRAAAQVGSHYMQFYSLCTSFYHWSCP